MTPHDPGLDLNALRALRAPGKDPAPLLERIEEHLDEHDGYLALSGGKDSVLVAHLARQVDPAVPVAWFDSGLEFPETRDFITDLADRWSLNLTTVPAEPSALDVLEASGAWDLTAPTREVPDLHQVMILDPSARAHEQFGPGELWGVRAAESKGRRHLYGTQLRREVEHHCHGCCTPADGDAPTREQRRRHGGIVNRVDGTVAYSPIWDWTDEEVWSYTARHHVPLNPIYDKLRSLGVGERGLRVAHVVDANAIERGRVTWLRRGWPALFNELAERLPRLHDLV